MIYILTPFMQDFKRSCDDRGIPFRNGVTSPHVVWVDSVDKLFGRKINDADEIVLGEQYNAFPVETINRLQVELALRKKG